MKLIDFLLLTLLLMAARANAATNYQTPNMGLTIPIPGQESGPAWANDINASLTLLDAHDHTPGKGVPITPAGMNINNDLDFNDNFITDLGGGFFTAQTVDPTSNSSIYTKGVDLYYKDGNGNIIQITASGGVAGTPGSIGSLVPPASATYSGASGTFIWQQGVGVAANMDQATLILRYPGSYPAPAGNYIAIQAPTSLATGYALTLPANVPGSTSQIWQESTGGQISYTDPNTIAASVTRSVGQTVGQGGVAVSPSSGPYTTTSGSYTTVTNQSVTLTTSGRPVNVSLTSDGFNLANFGFSPGGGGNSIRFQIVRDSTSIYQGFLTVTGSFPPGMINTIDSAVSSGTHNYFLQVLASGPTAFFSFCSLVAYEL